MKKIFSRIFPACILAFSLTSLTALAQDTDKAAETAANDALPDASDAEKKGAWLTSIEEGIKQAKAEKKFVLVEFTGSDWCPPCIMMAKKVFGKTAFLKGVKKDYVIVKIDMPNSDPDLKKENGSLMKKYKVTGVPTVLLFDAEGKEFSRFVASGHPTVKGFLKKLDSAKRRKDMF